METQQQRRKNLKKAADEEIEKRYGHLDRNCEMRRLAELVFRQAVEDFTAEESLARTFLKTKTSYDNDPIIQFDEVLLDAEQFIEELRGHLNPLNPSLLYPQGGGFYGKDFYMERLLDAHKPDNPEEWLSFLDKPAYGDHLNFDDVFEQGKASKNYWPIDDLSYICGQYLKRPWLHCKHIDRLLIRSMIYQTVISIGEAIKPRLLGKKKILGLLDLPIEGGYSKAKHKSETNSVIWSIVLFVLTGSIGLGAAVSHGWWAGAIAAFGFYMLIVAHDYHTKYEKHKDNVRMFSLLSDVQRAYALVKMTPLSPSYLRESLIAVDPKGTIWPVGIFPILDNAVIRDPILWGTND